MLKYNIIYNGYYNLDNKKVWSKINTYYNSLI